MCDVAQKSIYLETGKVIQAMGLALQGLGLGLGSLSTMRACVRDCVLVLYCRVCAFINVYKRICKSK